MHARTIGRPAILLVLLGALWGCSPGPTAILITNATASTIDVIYYKDGAPEPAGRLIPGEARSIPLGVCSGTMSAVETTTDRVVAGLPDACVASWRVAEPAVAPSAS